MIFLFKRYLKWNPHIHAPISENVATPLLHGIQSDTLTTAFFVIFGAVYSALSDTTIFVVPNEVPPCWF